MSREIDLGFAESLHRQRCEALIKKMRIIGVGGDGEDSFDNYNGHVHMGFNIARSKIIAILADEIQQYQHDL